MEGQAPAAPAQTAPAAAPAQAAQAPQQGGQQQAEPDAKTQGMVKKALEPIANMISKIGDQQTIIQVLQCITQSKNIMEALGKLKGILSQKNKQAQDEKKEQAASQEQPTDQAGEEQQAAEATELDEGLFDRAKAKANAWAQGAKAAGTNVAAWAQKKATGDTNLQKQDVYGSMQTGKFGTLIQQYIGKIQSLKKEMTDFVAKSKDEEAKKQTEEMIAQVDSFVKAGQEALDSAKADLKKAGGDRQAAAQQQQGGDEKKPDGGEEKKDGEQKQGDAKPADNQQGEKSAAGDKKEEAKPEDNKGDGDQQINENTKLTLTIGQLRRLTEQAVNEGWFSNVAQKAGQVAKGIGQAVAGAAKTQAQNAKAFAKQAASDIKQGAVNLATTGDTRGAAGPQRFAADLSRIIGELEMDLKDCKWSEKQNPQLAQVIKNIEVAANKIHGQGEKGHTTTWDKIRHGMGKMVGTTVSAAVQAAAINTLFGPLKQFMSPRWYAALVAFCTVILRWYLNNLGNKDVNADKKAEKAQAVAQPAAEQSVNESPEIPKMVMERAFRRAALAYGGHRVVKEGIPPTVVAQATTNAVMAWLKNDPNAKAKHDRDTRTLWPDEMTDEQFREACVVNGDKVFFNGIHEDLYPDAIQRLCKMEGITCTDGLAENLSGCLGRFHNGIPLSLLRDKNTMKMLSQIVGPDYEDFGRGNTHAFMYDLFEKLKPDQIVSICSQQKGSAGAARALADAVYGQLKTGKDMVPGETVARMLGRQISRVYNQLEWMGTGTAVQQNGQWVVGLVRK